MFKPDGDWAARLEGRTGGNQLLGRRRMTPATKAEERRRSRAIAIGLLAVAVAAALAVGAAALMSGDSSRNASRSHGRLGACVTRWNGPSNSGPRALMNRAALGSGTPPAVARRVLILRYAGPPLEDVGV